MYEYLYELIKEDIADGKLKADEKLPSKRGYRIIQLWFCWEIMAGIWENMIL